MTVWWVVPKQGHTAKVVSTLVWTYTVLLTHNGDKVCSSSSMSSSDIAWPFMAQPAPPPFAFSHFVPLPRARSFTAFTTLYTKAVVCAVSMPLIKPYECRRTRISPIRNRQSHDPRPRDALALALGRRGLASRADPRGRGVRVKRKVETRVYVSCLKSEIKSSASSRYVRGLYGRAESARFLDPACAPERA